MNRPNPQDNFSENENPALWQEVNDDSQFQNILLSLKPFVEIRPMKTYLETQNVTIGSVIRFPYHGKQRIVKVESFGKNKVGESYVRGFDSSCKAYRTFSQLTIAASKLEIVE